MANPAAALAELNRIKRGDPSVSELLEMTGLQSLMSELSSISSKVDEARQGLESAVASSSDEGLNALQSGLGELQSVLSSLEQTVVDSKDTIVIPDVDLNPILEGLTAVAALVKGIKIPETDLTDVMLSQQLMAKSVAGIKIPNPIDHTDRLKAIEDRLVELEKPKEFEFTVERINSMPGSPIKKVNARQV